MSWSWFQWVVKSISQSLFWCEVLQARAITLHLPPSPPSPPPPYPPSPPSPPSSISFSILSYRLFPAHSYSSLFAPSSPLSFLPLPHSLTPSPLPLTVRTSPLHPLTPLPHPHPTPPSSHFAMVLILNYILVFISMQYTLFSKVKCISNISRLLFPPFKVYHDKPYTS